MNRIFASWLLAFNMLIALTIRTRCDAANPVAGHADLPRVQQVLTWETSKESTSVDRRAALQPTVNPKTAVDAAWWQAGFVKVGDGWRHAEMSLDDADSSLMKEYRDLRDSTPKTGEGQLKLANWCQSHKLADQERAHLSQAIMLSGPAFDTSSLYKRMGYRPFGDNWLSPSEFENLRAITRRNEAHLREWQPAMERIVRNWDTNTRQRKQAQDELDRIESGAAVSSLLLASSTSETLAVAICDRLNAIPDFEAAQGLATISVRSEWPTVRAKAIAHLKSRRIDDFAPALLSEMRSPFSSSKPLGKGTPEPRLIFREEADRFVAIDLRFLSGGVWFVARNSLAFRQNIAPTARLQLAARGAPNLLLSAARAETDRGRFAEDVDHELQLRMDEENDRAEDYNQRAATVLAKVSGQEASTNPKFWWTWWTLHTGAMERPKGVEVHAVKVRLPDEVAVSAITAMNTHSCLVAGTPVQTERGLVAIDQIQVGDRVLAKDVSTGEVDYKPVLHTTVRQPVPVKKFVVAGSAIVASEPHHFWSSGSGWSKTRELKTGQPIHTATGMSRVESIESQPDLAPVYNLVVADFHTYFVGSAMVLSHDVLQPAPTNVKVPGLEVSSH